MIRMALKMTIWMNVAECVCGDNDDDYDVDM